MPIDDLVKRESVITSYIIQDDKTIEEIAKANGNISIIKNVIASRSIDPFIADIVMSSQYDSWTQKIAEDMLSRNRDIVKHVNQQQLGLIPKQKEDKIKKIKVKKTFKSSTSSGVSYKKSYIKYNKSEEIFIRTRNNKTTKEIIDEYINIYGTKRRSVSSLRTKISRLRK